MACERNDIIILQNIECLPKFFFGDWLVLVDAIQVSGSCFRGDKIEKISVLQAHHVNFLAEIVLIAKKQVNELKENFTYMEASNIGSNCTKSLC